MCARTGCLSKFGGELCYVVVVVVVVMVVCVCVCLCACMRMREKEEGDCDGVALCMRWREGSKLCEVEGHTHAWL